MLMKLRECLCEIRMRKLFGKRQRGEEITPGDQAKFYFAKALIGRQRLVAYAFARSEIFEKAKRKVFSALDEYAERHNALREQDGRIHAPF